MLLTFASFVFALSPYDRTYTIDEITGFITCIAHEESTINISIPKQHAFVSINGVKKAEITYLLSNKLTSVDKVVTASMDHIIGIDLAEYTGFISIKFPSTRNIYIVYAIFDNDCDERYVFNMVDANIEINTSTQLKSCIFNALPPSYVVSTNVEDSISNVKYFDNQGEMKLPEQIKMLTVHRPVLITVKTPVDSYQSIAFFYGIDWIQPAWQGYMHRNLSDTSFKHMLYDHEDIHDIYQEQKHPKTTYAPPMFVFILLCAIFDNYIGAMSENEDEELLLSENEDKC